MVANSRGHGVPHYIFLFNHLLHCQHRNFQSLWAVVNAVIFLTCFVHCQNAAFFVAFRRRSVCWIDRLDWGAIFTKAARERPSTQSEENWLSAIFLQTGGGLRPTSSTRVGKISTFSAQDSSLRAGASERGIRNIRGT